MSTFQRDEEMLEQILDRQGLTTVLGMISNICVQKAAHVRECWQDAGLARKWSNAAFKFAKLEIWAKRTGPA